MPAGRITRSRANHSPIEELGGITEKKKSSNRGKSIVPSNKTGVRSQRMRTRRGNVGGGEAAEISEPQYRSDEETTSTVFSDGQEGDATGELAAAVTVPYDDQPPEKGIRRKRTRKKAEDAVDGRSPKRQNKEDKGKLEASASNEEPEAAQRTTPFQRLLKTSSTIVSSAVKGVMNVAQLISPRDAAAKESKQAEVEDSRTKQADTSEEDDPLSLVEVLGGELLDGATGPAMNGCNRGYSSNNNYEDDGTIEKDSTSVTEDDDVDKYEGASLQYMTVSELKKILRAKGLPYYGKKSDLVGRLRSWIRSQDSSAPELGQRKQVKEVAPREPKTVAAREVEDNMEVQERPLRSPIESAQPVESAGYVAAAEGRSRNEKRHWREEESSSSISTSKQVRPVPVRAGQPVLAAGKELDDEDSRRRPGSSRKTEEGGGYGPAAVRWSLSKHRSSERREVVVKGNGNDAWEAKNGRTGVSEEPDLFFMTTTTEGAVAPVHDAGKIIKQSSGAVSFKVDGGRASLGNGAAHPRYRTTPYIDRTDRNSQRSSVLATKSRVGGQHVVGGKRHLDEVDARRSVAPRQAPRSHSRWSDLVTRRILNNMQERIRTPIQDAKSQYVPTPLRSRTLPPRERGEVSPPRQGLASKDSLDRSQQDVQVQPSRLKSTRDTSAGMKTRRRPRDVAEDALVEGEPGLFKIPRAEALPEPRPVFGVESSLEITDSTDFVFRAPQMVHLDEDEEQDIGKPTLSVQATQHEEEFLFTPPSKRRLRSSRRGITEPQQASAAEKQKKPAPPSEREVAKAVTAKKNADRDRAAMPPPQPKSLPSPAAPTTPAAGGGIGWGALQAKLMKPGAWRCGVCYSGNIDAALSKCPACEAPKPGAAPPSSSKEEEEQQSKETKPTAGAPAFNEVSLSSAKGGSITTSGFSFGGFSAASATVSAKESGPPASAATTTTTTTAATTIEKPSSPAKGPIQKEQETQEKESKQKPEAKKAEDEASKPETPIATTPVFAKPRSPEKKPQADSGAPSSSPFVFGTTDLSAKDKNEEPPKLPSFTFGAPAAASTSTEAPTASSSFKFGALTKPDGFSFGDTTANKEESKKELNAAVPSFPPLTLAPPAPTPAPSGPFSTSTSFPPLSSMSSSKPSLEPPSKKEKDSTSTVPPSSSFPPAPSVSSAATSTTSTSTTTTSTPLFGSSSVFGAPTPAPAPTPATSFSSPAFTFGTAPAPAPSTASGTFLFGASNATVKTASADLSKGSSLDGSMDTSMSPKPAATTATSTATTSTPSIFGVQSSTPAGSSASSGPLGAPSPFTFGAGAIAAAPSSTIQGLSSTTPAPSFSLSSGGAPSFGASSPPPVNPFAPAPSSTSFGGAATGAATAPLFGAAPSTTTGAPSFGAPAAAVTPPVFGFGAAQTPGATSSSSTAAFGVTTQAAAPTMGAADGGFSIGAASSSLQPGQRPRTFLKARRPAPRK